MLPAVLKRFLLRGLLKKRPPDVIPRSGEAARNVDACVVYIRGSDGEPKYWIQAAERDEVTGLQWENGRFEVPFSLPYESFADSDIEIFHWYGPASFRYDGLRQYVLRGRSGYDRGRYFLDRIRQTGFNRRRLVRHGLTEVLEILVEAAALHRNEAHSAVPLLVKLYGPRCVEHPDWDAVLARTNFLLDALAGSGELDRMPAGYRVMPKALLTLADYQDTERRHRENARTARAMNYLTIALVLVGIVQIYASWNSP